MRSEVYFYEDEKDIPEGYRYDCENSEVYEYRNPYTGNIIHIAKNPPMYVKAIPIPDNATNGDVIKVVFANTKFTECIYNDEEGVSWTEVCSKDDMIFDLDWWNAPYKK